MPAELDPLESGSPELQGTAGRERTHPPKARLLVVEDEARIAHFLVKGLTAEGHDVVVAEDGDVGLFLAVSERFDAVVLDLALPGLSGLEVLARIRGERRLMPVIVLTGHDDPAARENALSAGASVFVTKPLVFEELRAAVRHLLERPPPTG